MLERCPAFCCPVVIVIVRTEGRFILAGVLLVQLQVHIEGVRDVRLGIVVRNR